MVHKFTVDLIQVSMIFVLYILYTVYIGIQVNYAAMVNEIPQGPATLRHLVLCTSGDHMGLCEVGKFVKCGKKGCRRCDTTSKCSNFN